MRKGRVSSEGQTVRFLRPGLVEEYTLSMDGVRQDFMLMQRPEGQGELRVELAVAGATVEPASYGVQLVLQISRRKIAYGRLRVTDATGKELAATMEILSEGHEEASLKSKSDRRNPKPEILVLLNDDDTVYPVRIDPTFGDANWFNVGGVAGADFTVRAVVLDGASNLYIGGGFNIVGDVIANYVAKWNGSSWSALGFGMDDSVLALAVSGTDLYAGGWFTTAGGVDAYFIAKWNGSSWSALGSGMSGAALGSGMSGVSPEVSALAVSGGDLYAAGHFTTAGGTVSANIARASLPVPDLSARRSGVNVRISWPTDFSGGFHLEQADFLSNQASWTTNTASIVSDGTNKSVTIPATNGARQFRLRKP